tara:strand:- start:528 stop:1091 length:564 start_codon:yes stop_codon:yes gene_type:complete
MNNIKNQKGFSLIELMIAVAIIGILAAIAIPNYQKFQRKSRQSDAKSQLSGIYQANKIYIGDYGQYTASFRAMNYSPDGRIQYDCGWPGAIGIQVPRDAAQRPALPNVGISTSVGWCNGGPGAGTECTDGTTDITGATPPIVGAAAPAVGPPATFTAACAGEIGGAQPDQWTIDQAKTTLNTQDGVN